VTVRTLETMLRLATAHAKLRLSKSVDIDDVEIAKDLLRMTIFNEDIEFKQESVKDEEMEEDDEDDEKIPSPPQSKPNKRQRPNKNVQSSEEKSIRSKKMKIE